MLQVGCQSVRERDMGDASCGNQQYHGGRSGSAHIWGPLQCTLPAALWFCVSLCAKAMRFDTRVSLVCFRSFIASSRHCSRPSCNLSETCTYISDYESFSNMLLTCRQRRNPHDEAVLFPALQEALQWAVRRHPPQVRRLPSVFSACSVCVTPS